MIGYIFVTIGIYIYTGTTASFGDFESFYWNLQPFNDMVPYRLRVESGKYFNRLNGVIIGFHNVSFYPAPTNWTSFNETATNDTDFDGTAEPTTPMDADPAAGTS